MNQVFMSPAAMAECAHVAAPQVTSPHPILILRYKNHHRVLTQPSFTSPHLNPMPPRPRPILTQSSHVSAPQPTLAERLASADPAFQTLAAAELGLTARSRSASTGGLSALSQPETPGCLYNSMTYALFAAPITGILWCKPHKQSANCQRFVCQRRTSSHD